MSCLSPISLGPREVPCQKCSGCLNRRVSEWVTRLEFECDSARSVVAVTLTYSDEFLPADGSVSRSVVKSFLKHLRQKARRAGFTGIRFFCASEYGEKTGRPHYHLLLFNLPPHLHSEIGCSDGSKFLKMDSKERAAYAWPYGTVHVDALLLYRKAALEYLLKYQVKSIAERDALRRGRRKEFLQMSLRPPIGGVAVDRMYSSLAKNSHFVEHCETVCDVPGFIRQTGKFKPIGRTMRRRARRFVFGSPDLSEDQKRIKSWLSEEMQKRPEVRTQILRRRQAHARRLAMIARIYKKNTKL